MIDVIGAQLDTYLAAFTPAIDIAWEGTIYTPQANRPYIAPVMAAYTRRPAGVGPNTLMLESGTYALRVNWPSGAGRTPAAEMASALAAYFKRGTNFTLSTGRVLTILSSTASAASEEDGWLILPVLVSWVSDEPN